MIRIYQQKCSAQTGTISETRSQVQWGWKNFTLLHYPDNLHIAGVVWRMYHFHYYFWSLPWCHITKAWNWQNFLSLKACLDTWHWHDPNQQSEPSTTYVCFLPLMFSRLQGV